MQSLEDDEVIGDPIGQQMHHRMHKGDKERWNPIRFDMSDSVEMLKVTRLIANMIVMDPAARLSMEEVQDEVGRITVSMKDCPRIFLLLVFIWIAQVYVLYFGV